MKRFCLPLFSVFFLNLLVSTCVFFIIRTCFSLFADSILKIWKGYCYSALMKPQNYQNHRKFYPLHHFVLLPILFFLEILGIYKVFKDSENELIWILFSILIFLILFFSIMVRQHYALGLQNRIVRLEFKQRYFEIYGKRSDETEGKLKFSQIAALRFAYDDEFKILLEKTLKENLSGDEIKKSIKNWRGDYHRI